MMNLLDAAIWPSRHRDIDTSGSTFPWILLALVLVGAIILLITRKRNKRK
ncbi:MAG: LPXTG cell wall anchor domain-containing protein [Bacteroidaceae bacterium]|nr:LPXTG cell wall anchor domain-containing protein [Bacteroidaceae bacterium]